MKVRISIGASSTTSFSGWTGSPLNIVDFFSAEPSTFQTSLFFSISAFSWLADKDISVILIIWMHGKSVTIRTIGWFIVKRLNYCSALTAFTYLLFWENFFQFYTCHDWEILVLPNLVFQTPNRSKSFRKIWLELCFSCIQ